MSPARDERRQAVLGVVLVSRHHDAATGRDRVHIDRADPRAQISGQLVRQIAADDCEPWATVTNEKPLVITLADDYGQRFVYRLGERDAKTDTYEMEWPD